MTSYDFDDVVLVPFPFTDQTGKKKRPAVVVSSAIYNTTRFDLILMAITSQIKTPPVDWRSCGGRMAKSRTAQSLGYQTSVHND
jgi:mRNA interferase MazF